ncbi:MAG: hypothetical protein KAJ10_03030 [Thermodesulfovibrionia bacterium]|nr:hypothetical protein [Thermodesulfovibrionia bacterium]
MENEGLEFDEFLEDIKQEKCFFCGGNPVFISNIEIDALHTFHVNLFDKFINRKGKKPNL